MPEFSTNQWAVIGLVLILGWLFGLLMRSGAGKWRRAFEQERALRIATEKERDTHATRLTELEGERERRIELEREREGHIARTTAANARIAELERDQPAFSGATAGSVVAAAAGRRDDLALIHGIGRSGESRLNDLGVYSYGDIIGLSPADEAALEGRLGAEPGAIADGKWREQADLLKHGKTEEQAKLFS
jgi:predicted flap endonuclease-1-like 5' DNA nuclease